MASPSVEVQFAQKLAANEKNIRDKALKKLRKYIRSRSTTKSGFSEEDLVKLWKGLHYCMWMQDKPLLQEELAVLITRLIFSFPDLDSSLKFFKVFLITEAREWNGIDRLRMDKFMMLVRKMLNQVFVLLKQDGWKEENMDKLSEVVRSTVLNLDTDHVPDSLAMHLADIFLSELTKIGWEQLDSVMIVSCLKMFDKYLQQGTRPLVLGRILSSVYTTLVEQTAERAKRTARQEDEQRGDKDSGGGVDDVAVEEAGVEDSDSGYDEDSQPRLKFDSELVADHLFEIGSSENCSNNNRQKLYQMVKRLRDAAGNVATDVVETEEYDPDDDLEDAVMRLNKLNPVKRKKKKKDQRDDEEEEEMETDAADQKSKNKKSRKRKLKEGANNNLDTDDKTEQDEDSKAKKTKVFSEPESKTTSDVTEVQKKKRKKKKKKKKKKSIQSQASGASEDLNKGGNSAVSKGDKCNTNESVMSVSGKQDTDSTVNLIKEIPETTTVASSEILSGKSNKISRKKKKKQTTNEEVPEASPPKKTKTECSDTSNSVSKQLFKDLTPTKAKIGDAVEDDRADFDQVLQEGVTEIWVPNKKYLKKKGKNKMSVKPETAAERNNKEDLIEDLQVGNVDKNSDKKRTAASRVVSTFAKFEKISTPPAAFVKKAVAKTTKTPVKPKDSVKESTRELTASEKRVKFNMKKNTAQKFEDSISISPLPAFVPTKSPVQGILKSPYPANSSTPQFLTTPVSKKKKKNQKKLLTSPDNIPGSEEKDGHSERKQSSFKSGSTPSRKQKGSTPKTKSTPLTKCTPKAENTPKTKCTPKAENTPKTKCTPKAENTPLTRGKAGSTHNSTPKPVLLLSKTTPVTDKKGAGKLKKNVNTQEDETVLESASVKKTKEMKINTPKSGKKNLISKKNTPGSTRKVSKMEEKISTGDETSSKMTHEISESVKKKQGPTPQSVKKKQGPTPQSVKKKQQGATPQSSTKKVKRSRASDFF